MNTSMQRRVYAIEKLPPVQSFFLFICIYIYYEIRLPLLFSDRVHANREWLERFYEPSYKLINYYYQKCKIKTHFQLNLVRHQAQSPRKIPSPQKRRNIIPKLTPSKKKKKKKHRRERVLNCELHAYTCLYIYILGSTSRAQRIYMCSVRPQGREREKAGPRV